MSKIRKTQLITTFGPGAIYVDEKGVSQITSGIDHWYGSELSVHEFKIDDCRLANKLGVDHFRIPPPYQNERKEYNNKTKREITKKEYLHTFRFPTWHVCNRCSTLTKTGPLAKPTRDDKGVLRCSCNGGLTQVRFVSACQNGHLHEFPWREWVHSDLSTQCTKPLKLKGHGGGLSSVVVSCDCGKSRNLEGITSKEIGKTLSDKLGNYECTGAMPWLGDDYRQEPKCQAPVVGMLRQASNLYFSKIQSSLKIPDQNDQKVSPIYELIQSSANIKILKNIPAELQLEYLFDQCNELNAYSPQDITDVVQILLKTVENLKLDGSTNEIDYRFQERSYLIADFRNSDLVCNEVNFSNTSNKVAEYISTLTKVTKLTETRALEGIQRIESKSQNLDFPLQDTLRRKSLDVLGEKWLPAIRNYGEGIYFELDYKKLSQWITSNKDWLECRISKMVEKNPPKNMVLTPTYVLVHTLSHILINQFIFHCGYGSAALRERIYVSDTEGQEMAGVLIYTAAGDTEGSLGGLAALSESEQFFDVFFQALNNAVWCSADPICSEAGERGGQGPNSSNLAACHNCSLLPETSCETMNSFLDRRMLISECLDENSHGFFDELIL
ncbi:DUF1998 domain-containing protein [Pseudoalteromonas distincta]|uniref:DUF1998 domain-containing protein n=1 Tax=Pseudoalteromonas distincta TaxID=77608 RepID=UPI00241E93F9|nr:DUF1998 domain-containing protein [Pseudoalteromonas distincta]|tara:strand:+ start:6424 stop:8259 length:1836 start_codon:yes stop_codon:yes gene_type:complete